MESIAINVDNVSKIYRLYNKPSDRLKEALGFSKKKLYQEHYALNNVSFEVRKGETVGIIGTNGSGKSTILKIITGVLNPTQGNVRTAGAGCRIQHGIHRHRKHLSEWYDDGIFRRRNQRKDG